MSEGLKDFFSKHVYGIALGGGLMAVTGIVLHSAWQADQEYKTFVSQMGQSDVTAKVCPSDKPVTSLTHTLVPVLDIEDRILQKNVEDMLRRATKDGVTFAFCTLAEGTTSFEAGLVTDQKVFPVLKINNAATGQEQQAAILQFLKEYETGRVSTRYNAVVKADGGLARIMPGRLPEGEDAVSYKKPPYPAIIIIPAR